ELEPPSVAEMGRRIRETLPTYPWLVFEEEGRVLGYAYASAHAPRAAYRWSVDLAVYIGRGARRRGGGRALYAALLRVLARQGYYRGFGGITLPNPGSVGLHEAMGFDAVGVYWAVGYKHGAWHDVGWWGLELAPRPARPAEPRALAAVPREE